ncbi:MAG: sigma-54-dependent Fis family transcriptional regulator, partial [Acidobacteria bacterium]
MLNQMVDEKPNVWVVDDDASTRSCLSDFLTSKGFEVQCLNSGEHVLARLESAQRPSLLILDIRMPGVDGLEVLAEMQRLGRRIPAIMLSCVTQVNTVVKAMRLGATDYLLKPLNDQELELAVERALEQSGSAAEVAEEETKIAFPSSNTRMRQIRTICDHVARADVPVLILGESGVGKEVVARYIHAQSERQEPFVKVNCAAIPADLLESELFGHERGAFTGAMREKPGKFELAGEGTLLLDEISEMNPVLQAKLLHVLQDGEYSRLGGTCVLRSHARILATTNKPLQSLVASGSFREDLYFRLNVITIEIPPLRERPEDIIPLCRWFVEKYRAKYKSSVEQLPSQLEQAFL